MLVFVLFYITLRLFLFCINLYEEDRTGCFVFIDFLMSCDCKCFVAHRCGTMGWSAVCNCGIS